ncbi:MAG: CAP domain-containing protein [Flavobacteriales bacterium]|nr:CAP domain-containing protein [Flavobacteriales bacterium]
MKTILWLLLGSFISTGLFSQIGNELLEIEVSSTHLTIKYKEDGFSQTLKEKHLIPIESLVLGEAGLSGLETNPNASIESHSINLRMLDSLVWRSCNRFRTTSKVDHTRWDESIYRAAKHHSYFQKELGRLQHGERKLLVGREEQQKHYRKVYNGAAEICLYNYMSLGSITYEEAAQKIVDQWIGSPGHNAIMQTGSYKYNGFGTIFDLNHEHLVNSHLLKKYNPKLYTFIKNKIPGALTELDEQANHFVRVYSSGNFTWNEVDGSELSEVPMLTETLEKPSAIASNSTKKTPNRTATIAKKKPKQKKGKIELQRKMHRAGRSVSRFFYSLKH